MKNRDAYADLYAKMAANIARTGRSVLAVFPSASSPGFVYTIGNSLKHLPELLVVCNLHPDQAIGLLNDCSEFMIERGREFADGELFRFPTMNVDMKAVHCVPSVREDYTFQAGQYLGHQDFRVTQILIPDAGGRFPPTCDAPYSQQPVLGRQS